MRNDMGNFMPSLGEVIDVLEDKNYVYFTEGNYNLNIVGVRTRTNRPNRFDDFLLLFYRYNGEWIYNMFSITTDPGIYWLERPMNTAGTAILKEGQYRSCYKLGLHRGKYTALVQRNGTVTVIRDFDRDDDLDYNSGREQTGYFGINIHRANKWNRSIQVDRWSAGCQVFADPVQFNAFIDACKRSKEIFGNSFTYTLIHERDFD